MKTSDAILPDEVLAQEMKMLWQESNDETRKKIRNIIFDFFDCGDRAERIITTLQSK